MALTIQQMLCSLLCLDFSLYGAQPSVMQPRSSLQHRCTQHTPRHTQSLGSGTHGCRPGRAARRLGRQRPGQKCTRMAAAVAEAPSQAVAIVDRYALRSASGDLVRPDVIWHPCSQEAESCMGTTVYTGCCSSRGAEPGGGGQGPVCAAKRVQRHRATLT